MIDTNTARLVHLVLIDDRVRTSIDRQLFCITEQDQKTGRVLPFVLTWSFAQSKCPAEPVERDSSGDQKNLVGWHSGTGATTFFVNLGSERKGSIDSRSCRRVDVQQVECLDWPFSLCCLCGSRREKDVVDYGHRFARLVDSDSVNLVHV